MIRRTESGLSDRGWLALTCLMDAGGVGLVAVAAVLREGVERHRDGANGFFQHPLPALLSAIGLFLVLAAGAAASVRLARVPLTGSIGRWVNRALCLNLALVPIFGLIEALRRLLGTSGNTDWMQVAASVWAASAVANVALAATDRPERARALLVAPTLFGWALLAFWLGDMLFPG